MTPFPSILAVAGALTAALASFPSFAHPGFDAPSATIGSSFKAVVKIPHGCDGSPTIKLRVEIPEGIIAVKPMPKPGWTIETVRGPYAQTYPFFHGAQLSEGVKQVVWTGNLPDDRYDEFVFNSFVAKSLPGDKTLYFPTYQDCEKGSHAWIDVPGAGQTSHDLKSPAPALRLIQAHHKSHGGHGEAKKEAAGAPETYKLGTIVIEAPWARATPGGARVGGGFLKITNTGTESDRLVGGAFPFASSVEVHEMATVNNVMKMRKLEKGLEIKPGETVELKPGGNHIMFMGLKDGLKAGKSFKGTLTFEKAGSVEVEFSVAPIGAQSGGGKHSHH